MGKGPLEDPRLQEIEAKLNRAEFDEAQQLLAALRDQQGAEAAAAYFATRLLYQRGRLDNAAVVERLKEVVLTSPPFPEAENMLAAAELGVLEPSPEGFLRSTQPPFVRKSAAPTKPGHFEDPGEFEGIPRAPPLPRFSAPARRAEREPAPSPSRDERRDTDVTSASGPASDMPFELDFAEPPGSTASTRPPPPRDAPTAVPGRDQRLLSADARSAAPGRDERLTAPITRSAAPDAVEEPSLFEVASAVDSGDPRRALDLLAHKNPPHGPEFTLLAARARLALGDRSRARRELEPLLRVGTLSAPTRTTLARLLLELGSPEAALDQAEQALREDPDDPTARLTYAWALVRAMRRSEDLSRAHEVETLLATTPIRTGPLAALALSLRASLLAARGPATRALSLGQAALRHDPKQSDALVAIAVASIRLSLREEAERAIAQLRTLDPDEAAALQRSLTQSTVPPPVLPTREAAPSGPPLEALWGRPEASLVRGDPGLCLDHLERACDAAQKSADPHDDAAWTALARKAALLLTEQPVFCHFAPYDSSVFSIQRLAAALDLLFTGPKTVSDAVVLVLGAYVGESVRQAYGGDWLGPGLDLARAAINAAGVSVNPCDQLRRRIEHSEPILLPRPKRLHPGADPFGNSVPLAHPPPCPWGPEPWPSPTRLAELGRSLPDSVVGLYCKQTSGEALDGSIESLDRLDRYLNLLAPPDAPLDYDSAWARRVSLVAGAYLGHVLVREYSARWHIADHAEDLQAYRVDLSNGVTSHPAVRIHDRLSGRRVETLAEYVALLAAGSEDSGAEFRRS